MNQVGLETNFQSHVLDYLNQLPGCKAENVSGNASQSGRPEINGCFRGRMFKLELKTADNKYKASKKQRLELRKWKHAGCVVGVIYSMKMIRKLFSLDWESYPGYSELTESNQCVSWFDIPYWGRDYDENKS